MKTIGPSVRTTRSDRPIRPPVRTKRSNRPIGHLFGPSDRTTRSDRPIGHPTCGSTASHLRSYRFQVLRKTPKNMLSGKIVPPSRIRYYRAVVVSLINCGHTDFPELRRKRVFRQTLNTIANCYIILRSCTYPHDIHNYLVQLPSLREFHPCVWLY